MKPEENVWSGKLLSVREVSKKLGVGVRTIYREVNEGKIPGFKFGGQWRFDPEVIEEWLQKEMMKNLTSGFWGHHT